MSYEYFLTINSDHELNIESLSNSLLKNNKYIFEDSDENGFSAYLKENINNSNIRNWGGDFYFSKKNNRLFIITINNASLENKILDEINIFLRENGFIFNIEEE